MLLGFKVLFPALPLKAHLVLSPAWDLKNMQISGTELQDTDVSGAKEALRESCQVGRQVDR